MIGQTLSHFKITAKLGEGGMGEVYRAEDTKLGREVAIKVLPESVAGNAERLARFEREAKLLASLNHPNIAAIYEVGEARIERDPSTPVAGAPSARDDMSATCHFLAMELAEGEDLADRLGRGPVPIDEAIAAALQIAQALEAAHESGVVHRDLKPANVMVGPDGQVKVLDFGLAKAWADDASQPDLSMSPTLTAQMTQAGVILGTAAYMSPEQAKGKSVDKRADVWAFGVILWEMLTGRRLFPGESTSEVLAAVLMSHPDVDVLPADTPARVRRLLERCLRQDPGSRLRDMGDARIVLEEALAGREWALEPSAESRPGSRPGMALMTLLVAAGVGLGVIVKTFVPTQSTSSDQPLSRLALPVPPTLRVGKAPLLAPDGRTAIFQALDIDPQVADHRPRLFVRHLDSDDLLEVEGSAGVRAHALSPDGEWLAFVAPTPGSLSRLQLVKLPLDLSSPPLKIADWPIGGTHLLWPTPETLLATREDAITPIPAGGGSPGEPVTLKNSFEFVASSVIPGGQYILGAWANFESGAYRQDVALVDWKTGEVRVLAEHGSWPRLSPTGHLVFGREDKLLAAPFDSRTLEVTGSAVSIMDGLWAEGLWGGADFDISSSGHLLYKLGGVQGDARHLAYLTADGEVTPWSEDRLHFNLVWVSPDGQWLATQVDNISQGDALLQIRVSPLDRPRLTTIGSLPGRDCGTAEWSRDSRHLAFTCSNDESTNLYTVPVDQSSLPRLVLEDSPGVRLWPLGFSPNLSHVIAHRIHGDGAYQLIAVPLQAETAGNAEQIELEEARIISPAISPDGQWLAYVSDEAGRPELFVRQILGPTSLSPRALASADVQGVGWSKEEGAGLRLVLLREDANNARVFAVDLTADWPPRFSDPVPLGIDPFAIGLGHLSTLPDGRFIGVLTPDTERGAADLRLALNWTQELDRRFRQ